MDFSIIVPTFNRPDRLRSCLNALAELDYPRSSFEVVVVDDGSRVRLDGMVAEYERWLSVQLLRQENQGPAAARNAGLAVARGNYVVFTDDDCRPVRGWLRAFQSAFSRTPGAGIGGRVINGITENAFSATSQILIDYLYKYFNSRYGQPTFFISNNVAFPAEALRRIGGFDSRFPFAGAEDRELCDRWLSNGYTLVYQPEAIVYHLSKLSFHAFCRQHFTYGRGAYLFHRARHAGRVKVEPFTFYRDLVLHPFQNGNGKRALIASALLVLSQVANAAGFFAQRLIHPVAISESQPAGQEQSDLTNTAASAD
jgi:GT2 family glycosyltransferase